MKTLPINIGDSPAATRHGDTFNAQRILAKPAHKTRFGFCCQLTCALMAGALLAGCRTPIPEESFLQPFDPQTVAQLSHEAYQVAYDATFWAHHDLGFAAFQPTAVDYEAVSYLSEIRRRAPWVAREVEKNPATPRVSSKKAYDVVAYDVMMLRLRFQPGSFKPSTNAKVKHLLALMDKIAPYYARNEEAPKRAP